MREAIILFSHGSLLCGAGQPLHALAERLRATEKLAQAQHTVLVEVGYLNYSEPSFDEAFDRCVGAGATRITVAPYFLVAGKFVKVDLPREIEKQRVRHPQVGVQIADAMRFHPLLADALLSCAERAAPPAAWRDILKTAPQFCRANPQCPLFGSEKCPATANDEG